MTVMETMLVILAVAGVGPTPTAATNLMGQWGGDRVTLSITAQGARMSLDCGAGGFPTPTAIDLDGGFSAEGTLQLYRPGPTLADERLTAPKAWYRGRVDGDRLTLDVRSAASSEHRHYVLTRNRRVKLVRCL